MTHSSLTIYQVPEKYWAPQEDPRLNIYPFVEDALAIEHRLKKGVNQKNERMRYSLCCKRILAAIPLILDPMQKIVLGENYLNVLRILYNRFPEEATRARIMACFFPPDQVKEQRKAFSELIGKTEFFNHADVKRRIKILEQAGSCGDGMVELADFLLPGMIEEQGPQIIIRESISQKTLSTGFEGEDELSPEERLKLSDLLKARIQQAMETNGEINFSNQSHSVITDVLNELVYKDSPDDPEREIRVVYMDGSQAEPFPLRCLIRQADIETGFDLSPIKASLISMRHLKMDEHVDMAWFRNRKVSVARPFAETDAYCMERTVELLQKFGDKGLHLHLYQTGLETAVVGFYRGLIKALKERRKAPQAHPLRVVPFYYDGNKQDYIEGKPWS